MTTIHAAHALLPDGWARDVRVTIGDGAIRSVEAGVAAGGADERHGTIVAGMGNLHSHAFQRGMAGLAEMRGPGSDSFWSWREAMYRFALTMTPEQAEAVASMVYVEMLEAGFTQVGEFHYLHHARDGSRYGDIAEMAGRIAAASASTGIGLTLLPVFYAHSGFGGTEPGEGQRRFVNSLDGYDALVSRCRDIAGEVGGVVGVAPHSLRAVTPEELAAVVAIGGDGPIHMHIAEQVREVEECVAWSGRRPVEWLLANHEVDARWCLVHATHMTDAETRAMAGSKAVAGLCPVTEANLGDGTFPAVEFAAHGGRYGVGSDSNVLIGLADELRQLEYSQRLQHRARNVMAQTAGSTGRALFDAALDGASAALRSPRGIASGERADIVALKPRYDLPVTGDTLLDSWLFANGAGVDCVWAKGRKLVEAGRHKHRSTIERDFTTAMRALLD